MIVCNDDELAERFRIFRQHGMEPRYFHHVIGGNFRLDAIQAAILKIKLPYLNGWSAARRAVADVYREEFTASGLTNRLTLPAEPYRERGLTNHHIYHQYVIRTPRRDALQKHLTERGIGSAIYYPLGLHEQKCFQELGYRAGDLPETERAAQETLALPIYPELTREMQREVVGAIAEFFRLRKLVSNQTDAHRPRFHSPIHSRIVRAGRSCSCTAPGGDEHDLIPLGRELDPAAALLSPRGKVLENGQPRFFRRLAEGVFDLEDLKRRTDELADFVIAATAALSARSPENGGGRLFQWRQHCREHLVAPAGRPASGRFCFAPWCPSCRTNCRIFPGCGFGSPGGKQDMVIPPAETERLAELLRAAGAEVTLSIDADHALTSSEFVLAKRWLDALTLL